MASQTDKKEEFRKYLEKGKVLGVLTTVLTDLFEMENKPEDPLQYLHQRFGESLNKSVPINGPQKDIPMPDVPKKPYNPPVDQEMIPAQPQPVNPAPNHHTVPIPTTEQPAVSVQPPTAVSVPAFSVATGVAPSQMIPSAPPVVATAAAPAPVSTAPAAAPLPQVAQHAPPSAPQPATSTPPAPAPAPVAPTQPQQPAPPVQSASAPAVAPNPAPVQ